MNLIGEIYIVEILIIQVAAFMLITGRDRLLFALPRLGTFVQLSVIMLLGYILSDIYRDTNPAQFLRGWARAIILLLDVLALAVIVAHDKRNLWWFVLGLGLGDVATLFARGTPMMSPAGWKFGYSTPITYVVACLGYFLPVRLASIAFGGLGLWNIFMDFRILGILCIFVSAVLWGRLPSRSGGPPSYRGLILAGTLAAAAIGAALGLTQADYGQRREQSNVGREAGLVTAAWAVAESPIIGYGSWPNDPRLVLMFQQEIKDAGRMTERERRQTVFAAHSQVLQAWVEGGLLGALFWFFYGYGLVTSILYCVTSRLQDAYSSPLLFVLAYDFWQLFMSPFSGPTRVPIAMGVVCICLCVAERLGSTKANPASSRILKQSDGSRA